MQYQITVYVDREPFAPHFEDKPVDSLRRQVAQIGQLNQIINWTTGDSRTEVTARADACG